MNFETIKEEKNETIKTFSFLFYWEEKLLNKKMIKALKLETIRVFLRGKRSLQIISLLRCDLGQASE